MKVNTQQFNKGAALITSLVLLMALTMVALSAIQTTAVQVLISGNDENTLDARQSAQSVVDDVIQNAANKFIIGAKSGYTVCAVQDAANSCDKVDSTIITSSMFSTIGINATNGVNAKVKFLKNGTAPRLNVNQASSASSFRGAYVTVTGSYDVPPATSGKPDGKASVVQGYVMILPKNQ